MSRTLARFAAYGLIAIASTNALPLAASAASFRVEDSGTRISLPLVPMRWRTLVPGRGSDNTAEGQAQVAVRLNVVPWLNQLARMVSPLGAGARVM